MKKQNSFPPNSLHPISIHRLITIFRLIYSLRLLYTATAAVTPTELLIGFETTLQDTKTTTTTTTTGQAQFLSILTDPTGNFSLTFLQLHDTQSLSLAVIHLPSAVPLWQAHLNPTPSWSDHTRLSFNGSLVISDLHTRTVFWSSSSKKLGDSVILTNTSNLQILKSTKPIWQSFDHPTDTLVDSQNLTSPMSLRSSNQLYSLRLVSNFIGLYAKFNPNSSAADQIYYKHTAMQVKSNILDGQGPVSLRINPEGGYLGMYQTGSAAADIQPFNSYQQTVPGIRRLRLESDGNLKAYYWSGSDWLLDYQAITETCDLPSPCGPYGLCVQGKGCSCLDNTTTTGRSTTTTTQPGGGVCHPEQITSGDLCDPSNAAFSVLRRSGVEVPFKEMMGYEKTASYEVCEKGCESNCSCWGVVYNNATGFCYRFDYPIQTMVAVGDGRKVGYFKMRVERGGGRKRMAVVIGVVCAAVVLVVALVGMIVYKVWSGRRVARRKYLESEEMVSPGPYKDLGSDSFGSIELSSSR